MENYLKLKDYLQTKYDYYANLGKYHLGDREGLESEYKWRLLCDIMEYVDTLELYCEIDKSLKQKPNLRVVN